MHVISRRMLVEFWTKQADAQSSLESWYQTARRASWSNLADVQQSYNTAEAVDQRWTVFNIRGNNYRLITAIHYDRRKIYIRHVLTHSEYSRGRWKQE